MKKVRFFKFNQRVSADEKIGHIYTLLIILISMYKADKIVDNSETVTRQKAQFVASLVPIHRKKVVTRKVKGRHYSPVQEDDR